jgi:hypothetical protein
MIRLTTRTFLWVGALFFALLASSPARAQLPLCVSVCGTNTFCEVACTNNGVQSNCAEAGFVCIPPCTSGICTSSVSCNLGCHDGSGNLTTCGGAGLACCPGDQLINRIQLCKAQFYNAAKGKCVLTKRFDDTYERCNGTTYQVNPDDFRHVSFTDAASCPAICLPGCEDLC